MKALTKAERVQLATLRDEYQGAIARCNDARQALNDFREEIHGKIESFMDDKSDKWREGERGEAYAAWAEAWSEEPGDEVDDSVPEYPEEPDGV